MGLRSALLGKGFTMKPFRAWSLAPLAFEKARAPWSPAPQGAQGHGQSLLVPPLKWRPLLASEVRFDRLERTRVGESESARNRETITQSAQ